MKESRENFTFSELDASEDSVNTSENGPPSIRSLDGAVVLSKAVLVLLILGAFALAAVVGLIVHFAHPGRIGDCPPVIPCTTTTASPEVTEPPLPPDDDYLWELCINASIARNECLPTEPCLGLPPTQPPPLDIDYRIPRNLVPTHYSLTIIPDIYHDHPDNFTFKGSVDIYLKCEEPTHVIVLHRRYLTVVQSSVTIRHEGSDDLLQWIKISEDYVREFMMIELRHSLSVGERIIVSMEFFDKLSHQVGSGIYWRDYQSEGEIKYMVFTQMEPTDTRRVFPCMDEPGIKSTFNFTMRRKTGTEALTNTPLVDTIYLGDDWYEDVFETTPVPMPPYLVAFTVADYHYVENIATGGLSNKMIRYWGTPEDVANGNLNYSVTIGGPMFDYFEEYFNDTYIWNKQDMIYVPTFPFGAMENWGLVTYRWDRIIFDPEYSLTEQSQRLAGTMSHELLHMWLGNVVTCDWWDDLWLQEGFARYYQHGGVQYAQPDWDLEQIFVLQTEQKVLWTDSYQAGQAVYCPVGSPEEADGILSTYTYDKGASVIRMMASVIGNTTFQKVMRNYVKELAYATATHDQLFSILDKTLDDENVNLGYNLTAAWRGWIMQNGYPVITFNRTFTEPGKVKVSQKLFLANQFVPDIDFGCTSPDYDHTWEVPLTFTTKKNPDFQGLSHTWFSGQQDTVPLGVELEEEDWIIGNLRQVGFYRVNYDEDNWDAIIQQLNTGHTQIHTINRAQLIDDTSALASGGEISHVLALRVLKYLKQEEEYAPFYALQQNLGYVTDMLFGTPALPSLHMFIVNLVTDNYKRLTWDEGEDDSLFDIYLRTTTLRIGCHYGLSDCRAEASSKFDQWSLDPTNTTVVRPDIREFVYCYGVKYGTTDKEARWNLIFSRYQNETMDVERTRFRNALTCTDQPWILQRLWKMSLFGEEGIRASDRAAIQSAITNTRLVDDFVLGELETNWDRLEAPGTLFNLLTQRSKTEDELDRLQGLLDRTGHHILFQSWYAENNIHWQENNLDDVTQWLQDTVDQQNAQNSRR